MIVASDFFTVVTARFRILYAFLVLGLGRRQILAYGVTGHPTTKDLATIPRRCRGRSLPFRLVALLGLVRSLDNPASHVGEGFTGAAAGSVAGQVAAIRSGRRYRHDTTEDVRLETPGVRVIHTVCR